MQDQQTPSHNCTLGDAVRDVLNELQTDPAGVKKRYLETERAYRRGWVHALASLEHISYHKDTMTADQLRYAIAWHLEYAQKYRHRVQEADFNMDLVKRAYEDCLGVIH